MNWRLLPFIRLLLPFILGVLLAFYKAPFFLFFHFPFLIIISLIALLFFAWRKQSYRRPWIFSLIAYIFFLFLGYQLTYWQDDWNQRGHFRHELEEENQLALGRTLSLQDKGDKWRLYLEVSALQDSLQNWRTCRGRLLAYISKENLGHLKTGDQLLFNAKIRRIPPPANPIAFDFARYMRIQNIYFQVFISENHAQLLSKKSRRGLSFWMNERQARGVGVLQKYLSDPAAFGVGAALILGDRAALDPEVKEAYSQTGAMHVLAVSGLHVGLVAFFLSFALGQIRLRSRYAEWMKIGLQLLGIWGFAFLTGASPSVLRAASMFSMLLLGIHLKRYSNIYNTLAASAFLLLCFRPFMLMEAGFQLSYLAVLGIVYFQPKLYRLWYIDFAGGRFIWKLLCVSIAAQIATLPISLYYFHQFPVYFWASGLIVVPAAMLILPLGLSLIAFDGIGFLANILGKCLLFIVSRVNAIIEAIQQLPGHLISGIWISLSVLCLLYLLIAVWVAHLETKRQKWLKLSLVLLLAIGVQHLWEQWRSVNQRQIVFYQIYRHTALDFIDGKESYTLVDTALTQKKLDYASQYFRWSQKVRSNRLHRLEEESVSESNWMHQNGFIQFYNLRLAVVDQKPLGIPEKPLKVDYLLVRNNPMVDVQTLLQFFEPGKLVFDASNRSPVIARWKKECQNINLAYYDLNQTGALIVDLRETDFFNKR